MIVIVILVIHNHDNPFLCYVFDDIVCLLIIIIIILHSTHTHGQCTYHMRMREDDGRWTDEVKGNGYRLYRHRPEIYTPSACHPRID